VVDMHGLDVWFLEDGLFIYFCLFSLAPL